MSLFFRSDGVDLESFVSNEFACWMHPFSSIHAVCMKGSLIVFGIMVKLMANSCWLKFTSTVVVPSNLLRSGMIILSWPIFQTRSARQDRSTGNITKGSSLLVFGLQNSGFSPSKRHLGPPLVISIAIWSGVLTAFVPARITPIELVLASLLAINTDNALVGSGFEAPFLTGRPLNGPLWVILFPSAPISVSLSPSFNEIDSVGEIDCPALKSPPLAWRTINWAKDGHEKIKR